STFNVRCSTFNVRRVRRSMFDVRCSMFWSSCLWAGGLVVWLSLARAAIAAEGERPLVHPLFSDYAVLQRLVKVPVWGWSTPGVTITVTFGKQTKVTTVEPDGRWSLRLDSMHASAEPQELRVTSREQSVTIHDVLVGD